MFGFIKYLERVFLELKVNHCCRRNYFKQEKWWKFLKNGFCSSSTENMARKCEEWGMVQGA